jgi:hypothetical protein
MQYELECGHCGYQFVLDVTELPRATKCAVCGGVLTLAVPVPVAPKPPPSAKPPPPVPAPPVVDEKEPDDRERRLAGSWPLVRAALNSARVATDFARAVFVLFLALAFVAAVIPKPERRDEDWQLVALVGYALAVPALVHALCQLQCAQAPRTHGGGLARASLLTLPCAGGSVMASLPGWGGVLFAVVGGTGLVVSLGFWFAFLTRLGARLDDDELKSAAQACREWLPLGLVLLAALLIGAAVAARAPSPPLVWFGRAGAGVLGFVLLRQYAALLRVATEAIDRHAPRC